MKESGYLSLWMEAPAEGQQGHKKVSVMCLSCILSKLSLRFTRLVSGVVAEQRNGSCLVDMVQFGTGSSTVVGFLSKPLGANFDSTSAGLTAA